MPTTTTNETTAARTIPLASLASAALGLAVLATGAHAGVLLDYGQDARETNAFGVVRGAGNPQSTFGFDQFQIFNIDTADEAWAIDGVTVSLRLFNAFATGEATLSIYEANGLEPDLLARRSEAMAFEVAGVAADRVRIDLDGLVLEAGTYFVGIEAASPTTDLLWVAGEDQAFRTGRRSDGDYFTGSPRALSLSIDGAVVPTPGVLAMGGLPVCGLAARRRRR